MSLPIASLGQLPNVNLNSPIVTQKRPSVLEQAALAFAANLAGGTGQQLAQNAFAKDYAAENAQIPWYKKLVSGPTMGEKEYLMNKENSNVLARDDKKYKHEGGMQKSEFDNQRNRDQKLFEYSLTRDQAELAGRLGLLNISGAQQKELADSAHASTEKIASNSLAEQKRQAEADMALKREQEAGTTAASGARIANLNSDTDVNKSKISKSAWVQDLVARQLGNQPTPSKIETVVGEQPKGLLNQARGLIGLSDKPATAEGTSAALNAMRSAASAPPAEPQAAPAPTPESPSTPFIPAPLSQDELGLDSLVAPEQAAPEPSPRYTTSLLGIQHPTNEQVALERELDKYMTPPKTGRDARNMFRPGSTSQEDILQQYRDMNEQAKRRRELHQIVPDLLPNA